MGTQAAMMILLHRSSSQLLLAMLVFCGLRAFVAPQERMDYGQPGTTMAPMQEGIHNKVEESISSSISRPPMKIYIYSLPSKYNKDVVRRDPRCLNHMFATEIYIHLSLLSKGKGNNNVYRRTWNPEEADWFYAPVYSNCNLTAHGLPLIDSQAQMMRSAIRYISKRWPFWNRTEGADHFFVVPHDFGACFHFKETAAVERGILGVLKRATLLQTFGQRNHTCMNDKDDGFSTIIIPPYVPPNRIYQRTPPLSTPRSIFAYFRGVFYDTANDPEGGYYSRGVRGAIWENFQHDPLFDLSSEHPVTYYEDMQRSLFCLCPLGWAPWSPRLVESVQMGCIPVIIADDIVLALEHVVPWRSIAVFVKERDVAFLHSILTSIPPHVIQTKQSLLASQSLKRSLLYHRPAVAGDAFHQIMKALDLRLPHPPNTYLSPGHPALLNWIAGPPADLKPW